jgi:hypothetical protein
VLRSSSGCSRRQLLALADALDLHMAQHPGWLRPGLRAPPPALPPSSRGAGVLRAAGHIATAPLRWAPNPTAGAARNRHLAQLHVRRLQPQAVCLPPERV